MNTEYLYCPCLQSSIVQSYAFDWTLLRILFRDFLPISQLFLQTFSKHKIEVRCLSTPIFHFFFFTHSFFFFFLRSLFIDSNVLNQQQTKVIFKEYRATVKLTNNGLQVLAHPLSSVSCISVNGTTTKKKKKRRRMKKLRDKTEKKTGKEEPNDFKQNLAQPGSMSHKTRNETSRKQVG